MAKPTLFTKLKLKRGIGLGFDKETGTTKFGKAGEIVDIEDPWIAAHLVRAEAAEEVKAKS